MNKIIFLDFDGVLIPLPMSGEYDPNLKPSTEAINNLNILVQLTNGDVVVTSAWRKDRTVEELEALLKSWGYKWRVLDKTLTSFDDDRGLEVLQWLSSCEKMVDAFVVIDDEPTDLDELARNRVMPKPDVGLQFHDVKEAIQILEKVT